MAYKSIYTYNKPLEEMRKRIEQRTYEIQMERKRQMEEARSMRTIFDVFLNKKGREKYDNGNWFETTFKAFGEFFDRNFTEWFRNPANALINNLSSIGDTLDYAANLIKAPIIAAAKGEDPSERLADAYGVGEHGRIAQNMSDLREALGANNPGAEIGASTGFGALAGAEIGSKGGPVGLAIGSIIGAVLGLVNSGIDVSVRESGTDNGFLKGVQTVANTVTDMVMEYGVDPANFFGAISNVEQATKVNNIIKQYEGKNLINELADNAPATRSNYLKFINGKKNVNVQEALDEIYHRSAYTAKQYATEVVAKHPKKDFAKIQEKVFKRNIKNTISAYINGDKKAFNRAIAELGMQGKGLETALKSTKQVDALYSVLRQDANLSALGRFANFVDNFDQGFAKKLYKSTVPGIALTSAKKAFTTAKYKWNKALIKVAEDFNSKEVSDTIDSIDSIAPNKYTTLEKMAMSHYEKTFNKIKLSNGENLVYKVADNAKPEEVKSAYSGMSEAINLLRARGKRREAKALQGYRKQLTLDNGFVKIKLLDAENAMKKIIRKSAGEKLPDAELDEAANTLFRLFYFEEGINFFQDMLFTPSYFKGNINNINPVVEALMNTSNKIMDNRPEAKYIKELERISKMTINWKEFTGGVEDFYTLKLHETTQKIIDELLDNPDKYDDETVAIALKRIAELSNKGGLTDEEIEELDKIYREILDTEFFGTVYYPNEYKELSSTDIDGVYYQDFKQKENKDAIPFEVKVQYNKNEPFITEAEEMAYKKLKLEDMSKNIEYAENMKKYAADRKIVMEGARLRKTFNNYNKSIDNSKNIIEVLPKASKIRGKDIDKIDKLINQRVKIDVIKSISVDSNDAIDKLMNEIKGLIGAFANVFGDDDAFSTYDMVLKYGNILSKGSTQFYNLAKRFDIAPDKVDEFLSTFKKNYNNILEFSKKWSNADYKKIKNIITSIQGNVNILHYIEADLSDINTKDSYIAAVFDYIFKGKEFDKDIPDSIKRLTPGLFTEEDHKLLVNYYTELTKVTGNTYLGGTSFSNKLKNVTESLLLSVNKNGEVLKNGTFVDAQIQQTFYNNIIKGLYEYAEGLEGQWKDVYKAVAKQLEIDNSIMKYIQDTTNRLYVKRKNLIEALARHEAISKNIPAERIKFQKEMQERLVKAYIAETKKDYSILNTISSSLFLINMLDCEAVKEGAFKHKAFLNAIDQAKTYIKTLYSNKNLSKQLVDDTKKALVLGIAGKASESNFNAMYRYLDKFAGNITKAKIINGKLIVEVGGNTVKLTSEDFTNLFNNISGLYKYRLLCNYLSEEFGINKYSFNDNLFRQVSHNLKDFYTKNIQYLSSGETKDLDVTELNKLIQDLKNVNNNFAKYKSETALKIKTKDIKYKMPNYKYTAGTNFFNDINMPNSIKITDYDMFNVNASVTVSLDKNGKVIKANNYKFNSKIDKTNKKIMNRLNPKGKYVIDFETTMDDKTPLQLTITDANGKSENILLYNPELKADYKKTKDTLLDARFVNDDMWKQNGQKTIRFVDEQGNEYIRYKDIKTLANDLLENFRKKGMIDGHTLYITGHNASEFDAEVMLKLLAHTDKNTIKYIDTVDTLWLSKLYYAAKYISEDLDTRPDKFDLENFQLSTVFADLFPEEVETIKGAHNAAVDTYMNMKIWDKIYNDILSDPDNFFMQFSKKNLTNTKKGISLVNKIKDIDLRFEVKPRLNETDIANMREKNAHAMLMDFLTMHHNNEISIVSKGGRVITFTTMELPSDKHIPKFDELKPKMDTSNSRFIYSLKELENKRKTQAKKAFTTATDKEPINYIYSEDFKFGFIDSVSAVDEFIKDETTGIVRQIRINDDYIERFVYKPFIESYEHLEKAKNNINSYEDLVDFIMDYTEFMEKYNKYFSNDLDRSIELMSDLRELANDMQTKMAIVYGNHMSYVRLNQQYKEAYILDSFFNQISDEHNGSALREVMYMLDTKNIHDLKRAEPKTVIGKFFKKMLIVNGNDNEKLFNEFPRIKELYNYTNRIKNHMNFRTEIFGILENTLASAKGNIEEQDKIRMAFASILDGIFGYGKDERASLDYIMTEYIKKVDMNNLDYNSLKKQLTDILANHFIYDSNGNAYSYFKDTNMYNAVKTYITNCINNLENQDLPSHVNNGKYAFTVLHPVPDKKYVDLLHDSIGTGENGLLTKYQTILNPIRTKTAEDAVSAQIFDQEGLLDDIRALREALIYIDRQDIKNQFNPMPTAYLEQINNKSSYNINSSMSMYSIKNANMYPDDFNEVAKARDAVYRVFNKQFDPITSRASQQGRNIETQFHTLIKKIKEKYGLSAYQMEQIADSISPDNEGSANYKLALSKFFDEYMAEDDPLFIEFRDKVYDFYKHEIRDENDVLIRTYNDLDKDPELFNKVTESIKAYFAMNHIMSSDDTLVKTVDDKLRLVKDVNTKLNFANQSFMESKNAFIKMFTDSEGNINYELMYKYLKENDRLELIARIPSDRYNNTDRSGNYKVGIEFLESDFNSQEELKQFLESTGNIKYSIMDKHNFMKLKHSINQLTSKKTYTNRRLFNNHPHLQKLMNFRNVVNKYLILPTKVFGLWNLGFTFTNTFEGMLKTMTATDGSRLDTLKRYRDAIKMHRNWSSISGDIAETIQGSTFCMNRNQWNALIKEYNNMVSLFGEDNQELIKILTKHNPSEYIKYKDDILKAMKSESEYLSALKNSGELSNADIDKLLKKYKKLSTMSDEDIVKIAERYRKTISLYNEVSTKYSKEEFDFVTDFINSPAAAAEMQNIKKAAQLNLIGNDKDDSLIDRTYKKVLFSEWGMSDNNPLRRITPYYNLSLNSDIETINRLALHLDLLDKGFTESKTFDRVLQTHFNYGDKSELELMAELFFPFISFPLRTAMFWDEMMDEHPQMIKIFADLVLTNWGKDAQNQYNQTKVTKGGLRISPNVSMESGASFLDSLSFAGNTLNVLQNRKLNPLLGTVIEGAKQLLTDNSNLQYRVSRLPLVSHTLAGINLTNNISKGTVKLYDIAPSIFNQVYHDNVYYYNNQERYRYRSIYNKLYTATGKNRWNSTSLRSRTSAIRNLMK